MLKRDTATRRPTELEVTMHARYQEDLLDRHLLNLLGELEPEAMALLRQHLDWVTISGGQALMTQGEPGDAMYITISGRLRAYVRGDDGEDHAVREMARGQVIGEMSLYTDEPRSATVVAIRDSVLVRLKGSAFKQLLASSARLSLLLTRQLIHRFQNPQTRADLSRPVTIALIPISVGVALEQFAGQLADHLGALVPAQPGPPARVCRVDAARITLMLQQPDPSHDPSDPESDDRRIGLYLDELEATHEYVLLLADARPSLWTRRCSRRCDEVLLLADADQPAQLHDNERQCLMNRPGRSEAVETLVLLHPADRRIPRGTRQWLDRRPLSGHLHVRPALTRDMARLARIQSCTAVGLVLAGGGARGLAHLGVFQALQEQGIEIDAVGGTSIGSVMAALVAMDRPVPELTAVAKRAFSVNPTGDFNLLPMLSLLAGRRLRRVVRDAIVELLGSEVDIEDLWKSYYCVASNYTQACEAVLQRGDLLQSMLASISIPGALPPVLIDGDLMCDGGTFNNFPVDTMRGMRGVGRVIGVDLSFRKPRRTDQSGRRLRHIALDQVPGALALFIDRFRPRRKRRYRLPSLMAYLMNVTVLYSTSRQRQAQRLTDLCFNPPLERVGMLQWNKFDSIVAQGLDHGRQVLAAEAGRVVRQPAEPRETDTIASAVTAD